MLGGGYAASIGLLIAWSFFENMGLYSAIDLVSILLFLLPMVSIASSLRLLFFPISNDRKDILGFVSLVGSFAPTLFLVLTLLRLVFPHRDTPTGL